MKKRDLTKKVLCTVLAASVFGVFSNGVVEAADDYIVDSDKTIIGEELTGQNVIVPGEFKESGYDLTVTGAYTIGKLDISGESAVNLNAAGNINGGIYMHSGDKLSLTTNNANIKGSVKITGGVAYFNGGSIVSGKPYKIGEGKYLQEDIRVNEGSGLEAENVNITGDVMAEDDGSFVNINGGSVTEVEYYEVEGDHSEDRHLAVGSDGKFVTDGYTEVHAEKGGKVTINDAVLNTGVSAFGNDSVVTVNNSSISTKGSIFAAAGAKIYLNGDANTVYSLGGEDVFMALTGSEDGESGDGLIEINGGTLKAENLRYLVGKTNDNPWTPELEKDGYEITKGGIVLQGSGVIETKGDQIFERGVDVSSNEAVLASTSGAVTNDAISYVGGTLKLTDEKYSLNYLNSALENLKLYQSDSQTMIDMTGQLVDENGEIKEETSIDEIAEGDFGNGIVDTVVYTDKNFIVGTSVVPQDNIDKIKFEKAVENGFNVTSLDLREGSSAMVITNNKNVTLGNEDGGQLITVDGNASDVAKVIIGIDENDQVSADITDKKGSFTIGKPNVASDTEYTLTGSVTVNKGSALNVNGQTTVTGGVELNSGSVNVGNGTLVSRNVTAAGNVNITGNADITNLTVNDGTTAVPNVINIGNSDKAGNVTVTNAELNGATVFLDPTWVDGAEITDASKMAVAGKDGKVTLNGKYVVGENSVMSFGVDNNEKAQETFAKTGLTWGGEEEAIIAGLYINGSVNVADGAVVVDGEQTAAPDASAAPANGTFTAADNSVVMVAGQSIKENAAVSGVSDVNIGSDAILYVDGAEKGKTYKILAGSGIDQGWADDNIISDNSLIIFAGDHTGDDNFDVTASYDKVDNVYGAGAVEIANIVDKTLETKDEGDKAFDFFNAAANANNNASKAAQIAAFNSAANMGELAGVNHGTYSMSNAMTDAVAHHLSLATHGEQDKDIWAHYIHNKEDIDGMDFGGVDGSYEAQYNGIVVGSDLYKNGKTTAGIALSYADGNINGSNIASSTKNDAEYYGASLYGRIDNGDSAILGDISYMHSDNDITQNNSGHEITASADADAFSIGIRAEQAYKAGAGKFVPYAGIRYMHLGAGDYSNSLGMEYNADDQNLWLLPVGVTYSAEVQSGDWTIKPIAEVGYVWTMGDRDTDQTVSLNGASDTFGFETADSGSFIGRLGIEAEKADVTYGLSYEYQKGDTVKANKWMANLTWSF